MTVYMCVYVNIDCIGALHSLRPAKLVGWSAPHSHTQITQLDAHAHALPKFNLRRDQLLPARLAAPSVLLVPLEHSTWNGTCAPPMD